ncbi:efflux RND transporter periplasmic adaptor subunit [Singulisphaera acidiphila]|uniref:RND family efflux transporter, MFP subunit n=1 Tax=Singulisphaera acidiphila (strain ATCC BAA-1392 / DSM 18658 / VKM B-2454 / MOB10) TaxID=886293 RepID=L0D9S3_SINAD|nr:efflux RND transporter periplasmic adaptor subunit [Singulisphaera acidiphila]AGA25371.1 RND family efflux transporter, MFP subunit [Singulisphaera acidiphila DSM 18658]
MNIHSRRLTSLACSVISVVLLALVAGCEQGNAYVPPPPPEVTVSHPTQKSVTNYVQYTGTTKAVESVDLRARVRGFLKERKFQDGGDVKEGELLLVIDEEPFQVQLDVAKAKVDEAKAAQLTAEQSKSREVATAQLALDDALLMLARVEETRQRNLFARNAASREDLDRTQAELKRTAAQVDADKAKLEQSRADYETQILAAKAKLEAANADVRNAEINLSYCRIKAPISGRISRRLVDVGNLVGDGEATLLATILKEDPIYAYMSISEADVLGFRAQVRHGDRVDYKKEKVTLDLGLANEKGFPHEGRLDYADPGVDPATGTLIARGIFPNPNDEIVSGLFVRIRVALEARPNALLVPDRALGADQVGPFLLVVDKENVVERRAVKLGAEIDGQRVIEENLKPDDLIVINGLQRARPGSKVNPKLVTTATSGEVKSASPAGEAKSTAAKAAPQPAKTPSP